QVKWELDPNDGKAGGITPQGVYSAPEAFPSSPAPFKVFASLNGQRLEPAILTPKTRSPYICASNALLGAAPVTEFTLKGVPSETKVTWSLGSSNALTEGVINATDGIYSAPNPLPVSPHDVTVIASYGTVKSVQAAFPLATALSTPSSDNSEPWLPSWA